MPMPPFPKADIRTTSAVGLGASQDDPLHLFDAPPVIPASAPPPHVEAPSMQQPVPNSIFPGPGTGFPGLGTDASKDDPLHLFDGPPKPISENPTVASKPMMDDPLHLFDAPQAPASPFSTPLGMAENKVSAASGESRAPQGMSGAGANAAPEPGQPAMAPPVPASNGLDMMGGAIKPPIAPAKVPAARMAKLTQLPTGPSQVTKARSFVAPWLLPIAQKTKIPVLVLELLLVLVPLGVATGLFFFFQKPSYQLVDRIEALRPTRTEVGEVVELDITAYLDLEGKIKQMGFTPLTRLSVPEIPAPNLFSVYLNPASKTYGIILKVPGSNMPLLSFVNILQDGTWLSTNGWPSKDQELEKLSSESAPKEEPAALWARHQKRLDQTEVGVANANDWRFICALSDHLRWFMALRGIPPYKAAFADWF
jgi:hypothetical protein